ncbi:aminotransferase class V-fold PLP-dependent enzyme [Pseudaestuariivita atlantica]|uniref:NifS n=1 Tax=Pseudaestuariivita atlantica TaxID=1317121 RepID=A0A0L1JL26_9RHOB|nr:aminotransferase class V-fold PLP-dependent enzyme [Pseudaestuariivita atlantica]KNG92451.1 NifS [Pseudaestuariivita atlantica]
MLSDHPGLMDAVRDRFAHVEACPFTGPRIFFENAGGALTLKSVVETSATYAAIPDNQGRDNPASAALMAVIAKGKEDVRTFFNAPGGQVFVGETGTEVLFRLIRTAMMSSAEGGRVVGSTLEHPASRSAMAHWAGKTGRDHVLAKHDDATGTVTVDAYRPLLGPDLRVATIVQTSPVTGMAVDVEAIAAEIRAAAPGCLIVVDGIQHASHGHIDVAAQGVDGYAISPYKVFSRHGYGIGWASDRLSEATEALQGTAPGTWELGTRDTGAYATFSDVIAYLDWLGGEVSDATEPRARIEAAAGAIHAQEAALTQAILHGTGNHTGLAHLPGVTLIGGAGPREGVVSLTLEGMSAGDLVAHLNARGIRTHIRKNDHYCGNVLAPLGLEECVRVSYSHYNTEAEIAAFLQAMGEAAA